MGLVSSQSYQLASCLLIDHAVGSGCLFAADVFLHHTVFLDLVKYQLILLIRNLTVLQCFRNVAVTVVSFDVANTQTALCLAALVEQRRETETPAMSSRPATPVTTSSVIPTTKPMPETNRPALTAPLMIQVVPSEAHVPSTALTALRYFL